MGICEYGGFRENKIILDSNTARFDNFYVFKDTNPECPDEERYKGTAIELFGDSLDKTVVFTDGDLSSLSGKPVRMEITMSDAELYSFKFNKIS